MSYGNTGFANFREHLNYLEQHGEFAADGRPDVRANLQGTGRDELLKRLEEVHGQPRYDLYMECAPEPIAPLLA